ncbi:hypothetical protein [Granulicella sp. L60]|nr:hypothetical protein [Granulicella sp. L60]
MEEKKIVIAASASIASASIIAAMFYLQRLGAAENIRERLAIL